MKEIIISIVIALDCAWIAWLLYNCYILHLRAKCDNIIDLFKIKANDYKKAYENAQKSIRDLINVINSKFPNSTIEYKTDNKGNEDISGEIKY